MKTIYGVLQGCLFLMVLSGPLSATAETAPIESEIQDLTDQMYREMLQKMTSEQRQKIIEEGLNNPDALMKNLSPDIQRKLQSIARRARAAQQSKMQ